MSKKYKAPKLPDEVPEKMEVGDTIIVNNSFGKGAPIKYEVVWEKAFKRVKEDKVINLNNYK